MTLQELSRTGSQKLKTGKLDAKSSKRLTIFSTSHCELTTGEKEKVLVIVDKAKRAGYLGFIISLVIGLTASQ